MLYFDTDSVVFKSLPGQVKPQLGIYLGEFKDELSDDDNIVQFASGNPKNYGYQKEGKAEGSKQWSYQVPTIELPGRHSRAIRIYSKAYQCSEALP